ncbi:uncharacterized protein J3R85_014296 [Psidium guajava]|nr:uncharacterized protein J3R85_014296 [Psidium guajava]
MEQINAFPCRCINVVISCRLQEVCVARRNETLGKKVAEGMIKLNAENG